MPAKTTRTCQICQTSFKGRRDAKTCSPACRKRLQRQIKTEFAKKTERMESVLGSEFHRLAADLLGKHVSLHQPLVLADERGEIAVAEPPTEEKTTVEVTHQPNIESTGLPREADKRFTPPITSPSEAPPAVEPSSIHLEDMMSTESLDNSASAYSDDVEVEPTREGQASRDTNRVSRGRLSLFRYNKIALMATGMALLAIALISTGSFFLLSSRNSGGKQVAGGNSPSSYAVGNLPLGNVQPNQTLQVGEASELTINGQLRVNKTLVLVPGSTPSSPVKGQIYYNQTTNQPYYYNGSQFLPLGSQKSVTSLGGTQGNIGVGNGLSLTGGQLTISSLLQQQISEAVNNISTTGVSSLSGTAGQVIVSAGTGHVTLSLPQSIAVSSTPTFAGLDVNGTLSVSTLQRGSPGNNLSVYAGSDNIAFTANGRTFVLPNTGPSSQTICTTGYTCATGPGTAVELQPGSVQTDTGSSSSIYINNTGGGNLLQLQGSGTDSFVVSNAGNVTSRGDMTLQGGNLVLGTTSAAGKVTFNSGSGTGTGVLQLGGTLPTGGVTYELPVPVSSGTQTLCTVELGNCAGSGAGVTTPGGTSGVIAMFTGSQSIADSILSQAGTTLTTGGNLIVNAASGFSGNLLNLEVNGSSKLSVNQAGDTIAAGNLTVNGTGSSSVAGSLSIGNGLSVTSGGASITGTTTLTGSGVVTSTLEIQGANALTVGKAGNNTGAIIFRGSGGNGTLTLVGPTTPSVGDYTLSIPTILSDDTICTNTTQATACSNYAPAGGSGNYIQNQNSSPQTANFNITGTGTAGTFTATTLNGNGSGITNLNGSNVSSGTIANTYLTGSGALTVTAGTGLNGGGSVSLGGSTSLSVAYGFGAGTAVEGNTTLTCAAGTGNLGGGGNNVTLGSGGSCNDITITNSPTFSGTLTIQGAGGVIVGVAGSTDGKLTLANGTNTNVSILQSAAPTGTGTATFTLPSIAGGSSDEICTVNAGNCAGSGSGVTTPGGTTGYIPVFTGSQSVADSVISQSGTAVGVAGTLSVSGSGSLSLGTASSSTGSIEFYNSSNGNTLTLQAGATAGNFALTLPTADGSNGQCLQTDGSGALSFNDCTGGSAGGVNTLDGLAGTLVIDNSSGAGSHITIDDASTSQKGIAEFNATNFSASGGVVNTVQDISASSSPTFASPNATTGVNTGAGAGTQRIDATGNLVNIGTIATSGAINGQTISGTANFTGTLSIQGANSLALGTASTHTGSIAFYNSAGGNTITIQGPAANPGANYTLTIPTLTADDTFCLANANNCSATGSAGGDLSGSYPDPMVVGIQGNPVVFTSLSAGDVLQYDGSSIVNSKIANANLQGGTYTAITGVGALASGSIGIGFSAISTANNIGTTATLHGDTLTAGSSNQFQVDASGNLTIANAAAVQGSSGLQLGVAGSTPGLLSFANSTNSNLSVVEAHAPTGTGNATFTLPAIAGGTSDEICTVNAGNCAGSGSSVTTPGGTIGALAYFSGSQQISDSILSQSGTTLTAAGNLVVNGASGFSGNLINLEVNSSSKLSVDESGNSIQAGTLTVSGTGASSVAGTLSVGTLGTNGSTVLCSNAGVISSCSSSGGGTNFILNGTSSQTANFNITGTGQVGLITLGSDCSTASNTAICFNNGINLYNYNAGTALATNGEFSAHDLYAQGSLQFGTFGEVSFITPQGASVDTKINLPLFDPGAYSQLIALGLPSTAQQTSRAITVFDARTTTNNQPPLAVISPDESNIFGLSWEGASTTGYLKVGSGGALDLRSGSNDVAYWNSGGAAIFKTPSSDVTNALQLWNHSNQEYLQADSLNGRLGVGLLATPANSVLTVGTNTTAASGGVYFGTDTNLYRAGSGQLDTGGSLAVGVAGSSATAFQVQDGSGGSVFTVDSSNSAARAVLGGANKGDSILQFQRSGTNTYSIGSDSNVVGGADSLFIYNDTESAYVAAFRNNGAVAFRNSTNSTTGFQVQNSLGTGVLTVDTTTGGVTASSLYVGSLGSSGTTALCRDGGTLQISSCSGAGGVPFVQGGNSFGAQAVLGTNDNNSLAFETNGGTRAILDTSGNLTFQQASTISSNSSALAITGGTTLTLQSTGANAVSLDSSTTGAVNIGTGANAKTVTVGNTTGATQVNIQSGSGNAAGDINVGNVTLATGSRIVNIGATGSTTASTTINIGTSNSTSNSQSVTIGTNTTGNSSVLIQGGTTGSVGLQVGAGGTINVGTLTNNTLNLGTGVVAGTIKIGGTAETGAMTIGQSTATNTINIGSSVGNANTQTINIGTSATAGSTTNATIGSTIGASTTNIQGGATGSINIGATGASTNASTVHIADQSNGSGNQTVSIGSTNGSSTVLIQGGSPGAGAGISLVSGTGPIQIGANATAHEVDINSTTGAAKTVISSGTGGILLSPSGSSNTGVTVQPATTDSTSAFKIQNALGSNTLFAADTSNSRINVSGSLNVGTVGGNRLFSDGFESGNTSLWNDTPNNGVISTSPVYDGKYSVKVSPANNTSGDSTDITPSPTVYLSAWVNVASQTGANNVLLMETWTSAGCLMAQRTPAGAVAVYNCTTGTTVYTSSSGLLPLNAWHQLQLRDTVGAGTGTTQLWFDGTLMTNLSSQNNGSVNVAGIQVGSDTNLDTYTAYFDDVVADTSQITTPYSGLNVDDSLHVGGTASFGSNLSVMQGSNIYFGTNASIGENSATNLVLTETSGGTYIQSHILQFQDNYNNYANEFTIQNAGQATFQNYSDSTTAFQIQRAGTEGTLLNADTQNGIVTVNAATDTSTLGSTIFTGSLSGTGWTTSGTGASAMATHTTGTTAVSPSPALSIISGKRYFVSWTVTDSNPDTGSTLSLTMGGQTLANYTFNSFTQGDTLTDSATIIASSTANLAITPSSSFKGTVSAITVQLLTPNTAPALVVNNTTGGSSLEVRASSDPGTLYMGYEAGQQNLSSSAYGNTGIGSWALQANVTGYRNTALGSGALNANATGNNNVGLGYDSLESNTSGTDNIGIGAYALQEEVNGVDNIAIGSSAMGTSQFTYDNVAIGSNALYRANNNYGLVAIGSGSGENITSGGGNTSVGYGTLRDDSTGYNNTALGQFALEHTTGNENIGIGTVTLQNDTTGAQNTAVGTYSLSANVSGNGNTVLGYGAGDNLASGDGNILLGYNVANNLTSGTGNIIIGSSINAPSATGSNQLDIGNAIYGDLSTGAVKLQNGTNTANAFQILQATTNASLFNADTTGMNITLQSGYSGETSAWATTNSIPAAREGNSTVVANGYIYSIAGYNSGAQSAVYYAKLNGDGTTGTWSSTTVLPAGRDTARAVFSNGYIYVLGGSGVQTIYYAKPAADGTISAWTTATTTMPTGQRTDFGVAANNGYIYIVGGDNSTVSSATSYAKQNPDGSLGSFTATSSLPAARTNIQAVISNGYIYTFGGYDSSGNANTTVYRAQINASGTLGSWSATGLAALPNARHSYAATIVNDYVYIMGGIQANNINGSPTNTVYYAHINTGGTISSWSTSSHTLPDTLRWNVATTANGYIYIPAGDDGSPTSAVYYASVSRVQIAGSLDLVGINGGDLADSGSGGSLTAGDTTIAGSLQVSGQANFSQGVNINGIVSIGSGAANATLANSQAALFVGTNGTRSINASGTINASGADYSEYIPWSGTVPDPGTIVEYNGSVFVVSSQQTAAFVGNDVLGGQENIMVAFAGQVPTKVTGTVNTGDILVNNGDGTAKAVDPSQATVADYLGKIGVAEESSSDTGVKLIRAAIGTTSANVTANPQQSSSNFSDINVTGLATVNDLSVTGTATINDLTVTGSADLASATIGTLTVTSSAEFAGDITIGGHIITAGGEPTAQGQVGAGGSANVAVDGTDTTGTITITTGSNPTAGDLARILFSKTYGKAPHVVLSPSNGAAATLEFYKGTTSATDFILNAQDVPQANTTYQFDYFIAQ